MFSCSVSAILICDKCISCLITSSWFITDEEILINTSIYGQNSIHCRCIDAATKKVNQQKN